MTAPMATGAPTEARGRHPATQPWRCDVARMVDALARDLQRSGRPWPGIAAGVLAVRGMAGLDQRGLARLVGVEVELVAALERGVVGPEQLPDVLRLLGSSLDWPALAAFRGSYRSATG